MPSFSTGVTAADLDIAAPVGINGTNDPDDVVKIRALLNGITLADGGMENTLDAGDTSKQGPEFQRMNFGIIKFQQHHFRFEFQADGLVEPNRKTIKKLKQLFALNKVQPPRFLNITPLVPTATDTDALGFSSAGLVRDARGDEWERRDFSLPVVQMLPVGGTRTLVLNLFTPMTPTFKVEPDSVAIITSVALNVVTLQGLTPGEATLTCFIGVFTAATARLVVRGPITKMVDVIHLGAPENAFAADRFLALLPRINEIFQPQANVQFLPGFTKSVTAVTLRGEAFSIDPTRELVIFDDDETAPPNLQATMWDDLALLGTNRAHLTVYMSPQLRNVDDDARGQARDIPSNQCWFRVQDELATEFFNTAAHEIGHCMGLPHILTPPTQHYLMAADNEIGPQNRIPAETLEDLRR